MTNFPKILSPILEMNYPNESVVFHKGEFILKWENKEYTVIGELLLTWIPSINIIFKGRFGPSSDVIDFKTFESSLEVELKTTTQDFTSKGVLRKIRKDNKEIECLFPKQIEIGNINKLVECIRFEIVNQEQIFGKLVKVNERSSSYNRLELNDNNFNVILDQYSDFLVYKSELRQNGGFRFLSSGKIEKEDNKNFLFNEVTPLLIRLSSFLQFINSRKCPPLIIYGLSKDEIIWKYVSVQESDAYEYYNGWVLAHDDMKLNEIWENFCKLWSSDNDKESLQLILHWYNEANKKKISIEGRIVLVQNALELMFNWLICERLEYVTPTDANNISASSKISFLLSHFRIDSKIQENLTELIKYSREYNLINSSETFVNIRNSIVHSTQKKRKRMEKLSQKAKEEALNLGIWYVEILLLKLLGYKGFYHNRCREITDKDEII